MTPSDLPEQGDPADALPFQPVVERQITEEMVERASATFASWRPSRPTHREAMRAALEAALGTSQPENPGVSVAPSEDGERCGRIMVGSGTDTYDPICQLSAGHGGSCKSSAAIDQHRLPVARQGITREDCTRLAGDVIEAFAANKDADAALWAALGAPSQPEPCLSKSKTETGELERLREVERAARQLQMQLDAMDDSYALDCCVPLERNRARLRSSLSPNQPEGE